MIPVMNGKKRNEVTMARIDTDGLEQELRCACCYNPVKSETGCDGGCMVDGDEFNRIKDTIFKRIKKDDRPRWIPVTNGRGGHECSRCREYAPCHQNGSEYLSTFCPNCGEILYHRDEETFGRMGGILDKLEKRVHALADTYVVQTQKGNDEGKD